MPKFKDSPDICNCPYCQGIGQKNRASEVSSAGLLSDTERLDYLEKYLASISRENDGEADYFEVCAYFPMGYGEGETLRDAIDECIKVGRQNESDNVKAHESSNRKD